MTSPKRYQANPVVSCGDEGEDGALLFNPDTDDSVIINPTGRAIWALLQTPCTLEEIVAHLATIFRGVSLDQAAQDAAQFVQSLTPDFVLEVADDA